MTAQFLNILAGLGLFFVGIKMLGKNLRAMTSGPFRKLARKMSANLAVAGFWGSISGFATQSGRSTGVIFCNGALGLFEKPYGENQKSHYCCWYDNSGYVAPTTIVLFPKHSIGLFENTALGFLEKKQ